VRRLEMAWLTYRHMVVPQQASAVQLQECRRALYAGMECMLNEIIIAMKEPADNIVDRVEELQQELKDFSNQVKQGKA